MGDPDSEERMSTTLWDNHGAGSSNLKSRRTSSVIQVDDVSNRDGAEPRPGLPIQSPSRAIGSPLYMTGHQEAGSITNRETWRISPEGVVPQGSVYGFDNEDEDEEQPWRLPVQLQPPRQALSSMLFQQPLPREPYFPLVHRQEMVRVIPPSILWNFYEQKKQMITRHHWKLTTQHMSLSNSQRCLRMLMKHHWNIIEFIAGKEREGQTEHGLLESLLRDHATLMGTTGVVLAYFEGLLMALPQ